MQGELQTVTDHKLFTRLTRRQLFGVRLVTNTAIVQLAANAGFDGLFIELEHSTLSINEASNLCTAALMVGITPFVRVPYQCGYGFVQRILDGGAMGVIFPHIHNKGTPPISPRAAKRQSADHAFLDDAASAVRISKYPPQGCRSATGQLPVFGLRPTPLADVIATSNAHASTVMLMIETKDSIENIDEIAAVPGADVLLVGSNDLSIELGCPGDHRADVFKKALEAISTACKKHGKVMGLAGIYDNPELQSWAVRELGVALMLGQQDSGLLANAGKQCVQALGAL